MTAPRYRRSSRCRALTVAGARCKRKATATADEVEFCEIHRRLRAKHGAWPRVPGWAIAERAERA